jgi:hypothetical protein
MAYFAWRPTNISKAPDNRLDCDENKVSKEEKNYQITNPKSKGCIYSGEGVKILRYSVCSE